MADGYEIIAITDALESNLAWLARAEALHRTLRTAMAADYEKYLRTMFAEGAEMAVLAVGGQVKSLAVYRCHHTTFHGYRCYVDDLVSVESERGSGFGRAILSWCADRARERGCDFFDLESGLQRAQAHGFYFRQKLSIFSFGFTRPLR